MKKLFVIPGIINRSNSLKDYFNMIRKYNPISPEHEAELAELIKMGDQKALDELVNSNLRFVVSYAKKFQGLGLDIMDLINAGNLGMIKAAKNFDATLGFKFTTFAVFYIHREIYDALKNYGTIIKRTDLQLRHNNKVREAIRSYEQENGYTPSIEILSDITNIPEGKLIYFMDGVNTTTSGDRARYDDADETEFDVLSDEDAKGTDHIVMLKSLKEYVQDALQRISPRNREIVCRYFGIGCPEESVANIASDFNLHPESIRCVIKNVKHKLRADESLRELYSLAS